MLVGPGGLAWVPPTSGIVLGREVRPTPCQVKAEGTTREGQYPEGVWIRVVIELSAEVEHPTQVMLYPAGQTMLVVLEEA
ncbi:MAG TPA: hypothetical protein VND93_08915 [Myxococcales bacterium]|nr:hypothetical protein [Myxococcales bacterium]